MKRLIVISGCSGGGKSTLLAQLARRGVAVIEEPGRRIVRQGVLPWVDPEAFARRAIAMALEDLASVEEAKGLVIFDRGLVDAAAALDQARGDHTRREHATGEPAVEALGRAHRYDDPVFLAPPWPEIYANDPERPHGLEAAREEYERLVEAYGRLGYAVEILPKVGVEERAHFVLERLAR